MYRVPPLPIHLDSYQGWRPSESNPRIANISNKISAADMWSHFISQRRPVIINGFLQDQDWNASKWTDLEYLRSTAGQVPVKIEPVHPAAGHFGTSVKRKKVKFAEFLDILQDKDSAGKWYLTTQYVEEGEQEQNSPKASTSDDADSEDSDYEPELDNVLPAPTNALSNDFPAKPELLGNLVLQQCNLWLGNSKEGKSSGLHHDFHDNLYILLSGYKRFLLFPPSAHRYLHPRGFIERVHPNGLIVYAPPGDLPSYVPVPGRKQQLPIRPDGLVPSDAARWRRKARLRVKREIDERAAADAGEGSRTKSQRKGKAKQTRAQELAEEALLQAEAELRICRMDEEGIDPEADTSDDDDYDDDSTPDLEGLLNTLVGSNGAQLAQSPKEEQDEDSDDDEDDDDDDDDEEDQGRKLIASLPTNMKDIGIAALSGDPDAFEKLRAYLNTVADSDPSEQEEISDQEEEFDEQSEPLPENGVSTSEEEGDSLSGDDEDDEDDPEGPLVSRMVSSNGFSRKRKQLSTSDDEEEPSQDAEGLSESDTVESEVSMTAKRVRIASRVETPPEQSEDDDDDEEEDGDESQSEGEESSEDEDSGLPIFAGADSGSEFGDVDEGEAELERLLAMAQDQEGADDAESSSEEGGDDEPQSFSRIPPHVLHRCLGVPDDPSRAMPKPTNGSAGSRKKKAAAAEPYSLMPGCPPPIEVFLRPGQMLYLPASWYHEVTSSSSPPLHEQVDSKGQKQPSSEVHMALNYWFHPPDALEFEPVEPQRHASAGGRGRGSNEVSVPGLGVGLGESALEHRGAGTGTHERPYRDAEVWDEVAHAVAQQVKLAKDSASK